MRTGTSITVSATDRRRLEKIVSDRNAAQKPVWRSEIVLLTARGLGTHAIMARTGKAPIPTEKVAEVVRRTLAAHRLQAPDRMVSQGRRDPRGGVAAYIRSAPAECKAGMGGELGRGAEICNEPFADVDNQVV